MLVDIEFSMTKSRSTTMTPILMLCTRAIRLQTKSDGMEMKDAHKKKKTANE